MSTIPQSFILKIYNPILAAVKTYKTKKNTLKIGSFKECDFQIFLPSLLPVHIIVDFVTRQITAVGNDVHCDTIQISKGSTAAFTNDSVIRVHSIFMILLVIDNIDVLPETLDIYDEKIASAASRFKEYSPVLQISPNTSTFENGIILGAEYEKGLGEFSNMPPITPSKEMNENEDIIDPAKNLLVKAEDDFMKEFNSRPTTEMLEAVINKKMDIIKQKVDDAINGNMNIPLTKPLPHDLGEIAIENEILIDAINDIHDNEDKNEVIEAELTTLERLKNEITDSIKEEVREEISQLMQEEAKEHVVNAVGECLQTQKFTDAIAMAVSEINKGTEDIVKDREEVQNTVEAESEVKEKKNIKTKENSEADTIKTKRKIKVEKPSIDTITSKEPKKRKVSKIEKKEEVDIQDGTEKPKVARRKSLEAEKESKAIEENSVIPRKRRTKQKANQKDIKEVKSENKQEDEIPQVEQRKRRKSAVKTEELQEVPKAEDSNIASQTKKRKAAVKTEELQEVPKAEDSNIASQTKKRKAAVKTEELQEVPKAEDSNIASQTRKRKAASTPKKK
ncbi:hypothetical protein GINT2_001287 [Glugoides intestinalis]